MDAVASDPFAGLLGRPQPAPVRRHHQGREHRLANAIMEAHRLAPHLRALAEFMLPRAPRMPLSSQSIRCVTRIRRSDPLRLDFAVGVPWMSWDGPDHRNVVAVDVDHEDGQERAEELARYGLPAPTLVVDPWSGRSVALWFLATPVWVGDGARPGPRILFELAGRLLAAAMGGTLLPHRAPTKNPWGEEAALVGQLVRRGPEPTSPLWEGHRAAETGLVWHTMPGDLAAIELRDVVAALADDFGAPAATRPARQFFRKRRGDPSSLGRNCALFDAVRWWSYDHAERDGGAIEREAVRVNVSFASPLPLNEVAATARSIARFMQTRWRGGNGAQATRRTGRDRVEGFGMSLSDKQSIAGERTAEARRNGTVAVIRSAVDTLKGAGNKVTQAAVAALAGLGRRTVQRYWHGVEEKAPNGVLSGSGAAAGALPLPSPHENPSFCGGAPAREEVCGAPAGPTGQAISTSEQQHVGVMEAMRDRLHRWRDALRGPHSLGEWRSGFRHHQDE